MNTESDLWVAVREAAGRENLFAERLEDRTKSGVPDAYIGSSKGKRCWIELKVHRLEYRRGQLSWALNAARCGEWPATLLAVRGRLELYDTAMVGYAEAIGENWPGPVWRRNGQAMVDVAHALQVALGCFGGRKPMVIKGAHRPAGVSVIPPKGNEYDSAGW